MTRGRIGLVSTLISALVILAGCVITHDGALVNETIKKVRAGS